jgi:hypothetical protein
MPRRSLRHALAAVSAAAVALLAHAAGAGAAVPLTRVFSDPYTNGSSQHATAVEPDTFAAGRTIVVATQSGRFFDGGSSGIGYSTSKDGGATWASGTLAGITSHRPGGGGTFERVSDPAVAYDARHGVWLIASIPLLPDTTVPLVYVSRSTDGGTTFAPPVTVARAPAGHSFDKTWIACDNSAASPFYGNCYATWDDNTDGDRLMIATSSDGGATWGPVRMPANLPTGLGGQPVVQPNGTVIVPAGDAFLTTLLSFRSVDGGATWQASVPIAAAPSHPEAGDLRSEPLPSAGIDAAGRVYLVWQDCRYRAGCAGNDIVLSTSTDGVRWTVPVRVPIGTTIDGRDNFIPGLAVDERTSGATARLGLTFYSYDVSACGTTCALRIGYIQSDDAGRTWSAVTTVAVPFAVGAIADTSQGRMVGDYISTSWVDAPAGRRAYGAFAVGAAPTAGKDFDEAIYVPTGGLDTPGAVPAGEPVRAVAGAGARAGGRAVARRRVVARR